MGVTPPEEIERQHQEAVRLLGDVLPACALITSEIPLDQKLCPLAELLESSSSCAAEEKKQEALFPCWSSRGHVDVSKLQALVREGYNVVETSSVLQTNHDDSDKSGPSKKHKRYQASDIKSTTNLWEEANAAVNNIQICRPSHDAWGIKKIMLLFCDDFMQDLYEMPWWHRSDVQEAVAPVLEVLEIEPRQVVRMLFASLPPGVTIPVHHDTGEWVKHTHRVHVPVLVKNPSRVMFRCGWTVDDMARVDCTPGHVFELNNQSKHAVSNCDDDHRVHMILDYVNKDSTFYSKERIRLRPGETLLQTRRSIDRLCDRGKRPTPSFFILGAQKAGTTSLYEYVNQHPLVIRARRRETHCLDWRWNDSLKRVHNQRAWCHKFYFEEELQRHPSCLTGDSTPSYLLDSRRVIPRLKAVFDWKVKFFVMLRDPIERAASHYAMVTSDKGTEAQLKARGSEWRNKSIRQVVADELHKMKEHGLIPYFDIDSGIVNEAEFEKFSGSAEENNAWDRLLAADIPLNTGSYCLLARGLYELNLRPWLAAFDPDDFLILRLESMKEPGGVNRTMTRVWRHLGIPPVHIYDDEAKNQRDYESPIDAELKAYLERFYEPHNSRLDVLLKELSLASSSK